jgi:recombination associated protein RdgC
MQVSKLALSWNEKIECVLDEKLAIKRLRFTDVVQEQVENADDMAAQFDADFAMMTLELSAFTKALVDALGGASATE